MGVFNLSCGTFDVDCCWFVVFSSSDDGAVKTVWLSRRVLLYSEHEERILPRVEEELTPSFILLPNYVAKKSHSVY